MAALAWVQGVPTARWVGWTKIVLVLALAATAADLTWRLLPEGDGRAGEPAGRSTARPAARSEQRLLPVADLNLFGVADAGTQASSMEAPETRLNLTLHGVLATLPPMVSLAIIAAAGGVEEHYHVGDPLPGGAVLEQVLPDRVILKRNGRLESLYLPRDASPEGGAPMTGDRAGAAQAGGRGALDVGTRLGEYRERILKDPQEALTLARVQPVMEDGKLKGYKLTPNKEKQLFDAAGLRPGDVVTSVNGVLLNDPATVSQVMGEISTAGELSLTLDREGRQETVVVPLGGK